MFDSQPSPESVQRYGNEAAASFAQIKRARFNLMRAFDLLTAKTDTVQEAGEAAHDFDYLWTMLNYAHNKVLQNMDDGGGSDD